MNFNREFAIFQFKMNAKKRIRMWRKIQSMIRNGVPILEAIQEMLRRAASKSKSHPDVIMLNEWRIELQKGHRFSVAVASWVPSNEIMIIAAADDAGRLSDGFDSAMLVTRSNAAIKSAVIGGLAYPSFLFALALGMMWMFGTQVIPKFSMIAGDDSKWTGLASVVVKLSYFTQHYLLFVVIGLIVFIGAIFWSLSRWDSSLRIKLDKYPPFSIYRMVTGASWLISLSALIKSGVRLEAALQKLASNSGLWMKNRIFAAIMGLRSGSTLGDALAKSGYNFPDEEIIDDLMVYSKLSGFDDALSILGNEWINEGVSRIRDQMKVLFSIAILCVASVIAIEAGGLFAMQGQLQTIIKQR